MAVSPVKSVINNLRRTWTELTKKSIDNSIPCGLQGKSAGAGLELSIWVETRLHCQGTTGENLLQLRHPFLKNLRAWDIT